MRKILPAILFIGVLVTLFADRAVRMWRDSHHDVHQLFDQWGGGSSLWTPTLIVQAALTVIFVIACLFVIFSKRYESKERYWAYSALGTILGFWLRTACLHQITLRKLESD